MFEESCRGISDALTVLGVECSVQTYTALTPFAEDVVYIVTGLHKFEGELPKQFIVVQTEKTTSK